MSGHGLDDQPGPCSAGIGGVKGGRCLADRVGGDPGLLAATTGRSPSSGSDLAVLDDVRAWAATAGVVVAAGREGRALRRWRRRIVAVNEVSTGAASDWVSAEVSVQRVVVRTTGDHVIERAAVAGPPGP